MERCGWPAIPYDGQLLVSHQDALLIGGKVQAPPGFADHVRFIYPDFCERCAAKMCIEMCSGQAITPGPAASPSSTAKSACTAAPACGTAARRSTTTPSAATSPSAPAPAACTPPRTDLWGTSAAPPHPYAAATCFLTNSRSRPMASTSFAGRYAISIESGPVNFARASVAKNRDQSTIPSPSGQGVGFPRPARVFGPVEIVERRPSSTAAAPGAAPATRRPRLPRPRPSRGRTRSPPTAGPGRE